MFGEQGRREWRKFISSPAIGASETVKQPTSSMMALAEGRADNIAQ